MAPSAQLARSEDSNPDHLIRSRFVLYTIFPGSAEADQSFPDQHREGRGHRGLARHCAGAQPGQWGIFLQAGEEFPASRDPELSAKLWTLFEQIANTR